MCMYTVILCLSFSLVDSAHHKTGSGEVDPETDTQNRSTATEGDRGSDYLFHSFFPAISMAHCHASNHAYSTSYTSRKDSDNDK